MIRYDLDGEVATLTFDRPEKRNALTLDGLREFREALDRGAEEARAVVLRGAGEAFCAGDDIASVAGLGEEVAPATLATRLYDALFGPEQVEVPVIAAVDGPAYGGGFEVVAAADLAVATADATFALPEATIGAYPPYAVARVGEACGRKRLLELALTGDPIDAETARSWGLCNRVVDADDPDALNDAVAGLTESVCSVPAPSVALVKRYVRAATADADERARLVEGFSTVADEPECRAAAERFLSE
ncbi:enoyl-CoA hydratase/isomerase family protein [Halobaculum sp. CBA1158]|uniref:enoyl-CoA hydratase/isomerase family protein n=1 Tax=Halobaculum sp. CBA1158 TaxID=2904243 RepID=UPI001F17DAD3|nr:enoyl-CoA hydratase/isomerase family protein [Halobaculum sp. CBA1158]UIO98571.1 enoyl-CoA hydratase/isomerase family protein [Halobaculum sp. CBA1158]